MLTRMPRKFLLAILALLISIPLLIVAQQPERVDLNAIHKIKTEEFEHSKVMDILYNLTDRYGPRLTNSPQFRAAGEWAVKQLHEWGLSKAHLEKWGPFGNGWVRNQATGVEMRAATTAKNGSYRFSGLDAGEYTLEAVSPELGQGRLRRRSR